MASSLNRRRFIGISAAAAGLSLLPIGHAGTAQVHAVTWHGKALGAPASLVIHHHDHAAARRLVEGAVVEVARLESVFSLYRRDSALAELNRIGTLAAPPADLVALLQASAEFWEASGGAFDPTVQPLWMLYAAHFSRPGADPAGPSAEQLREVIELVDLGNVSFNRDRIVLGKPGMGLTFNGIAQGYIADRIVDLLRNGGIEKSLVDMGEIRALGTRPDGHPWKVGVANTADAARPIEILEVADRAVATSSPDGFHFDRAGRFTHLLDPRTGHGARLYQNVTVIAREATTADALSTTFSLLEPGRVHGIAADRPDVQVRLVAKGR
jgi:thiamine biosynthesis lipoprotein